MANDEMLVVIKQMFEQSMGNMENKFGKKVDEVKVIVENLENKIQIVAEGHDILNRNIDEVKQDVKSLKSDMNIVKDYVIGVDVKLSEHEIILKRVK